LRRVKNYGPTKLLLQDDKSPAVAWMEMEAFELIFEAEDFENLIVALSIFIKLE
jgi:hypothetical protein